MARQPSAEAPRERVTARNIIDKIRTRGGRQIVIPRVDARRLSHPLDVRNSFTDRHGNLIPPTNVGVTNRATGPASRTAGIAHGLLSGNAGYLHGEVAGLLAANPNATHIVVRRSRVLGTGSIVVEALTRGTPRSDRWIGEHDERRGDNMWHLGDRGAITMHVEDVLHGNNLRDQKIPEKSKKEEALEEINREAKKLWDLQRNGGLSPEETARIKDRLDTLHFRVQFGQYGPDYELNKDKPPRPHRPGER